MQWDFWSKMKNILQRLTGPLLLGLIVVMGWYGGWWEGLFQQQEAVKTSQTRQGVPGVVISKTNLVGWANQAKAWEIGAVKIWQSSEGSQVFFDKINRGIIFSLEGQKVEFTAGWVRWEKLRSELYIGNGIKAKIDQGVFITTEAMVNYENQVMEFNRKVTFNGKNVIIKADKMRFDFANDQLLLEGNVSLSQDDNRVKAERFIYNLKDDSYQLIEPEGVSLTL
jgi:hypothetical protein